jgi:hypothetical protein
VAARPEGLRIGDTGNKGGCQCRPYARKLIQAPQIRVLLDHRVCGYE